MVETIWIKDADWVIAWDSETEGHKYIRKGDVVFSGKDITFVGRGYGGGADTIIDGADLLIMPGLINLHAHSFFFAHFKGFYEDLASKHLWMSVLYEYAEMLEWDEESAKAATEATICEMLKSGCTTVADMAFCPLPFPDWLDTFARSGMRAYACLMMREAEWYTIDGKDVRWRWFGKGGEARHPSSGLSEALAVIDEAESHPSGRIKGMVGPMQVETCTEELFKKCKKEANRRGIPMQTHASQSVVEFREMIRRHKKTPIEWLQDIGVLDSNTLIGHGLNIDQHPWVNYYEHKDLERLAKTGTTVVHCPRGYAQCGDMMRSLGGYRAAGVNMAFGTDGYPNDLIEEMRIAGLLSKVASGNVDLLKTQDVFEIGTVGGAKALHRNDLGRIFPGGKADIVLVDLKHPSMMPVRDPLKSLIYSGTADAVRDVYVDGNLVVKDRKVLTIDQNDALDRLQAGQERALARVPKYDWAHRNADEVSPLSLPLG